MNEQRIPVSGAPKGSRLRRPTNVRRPRTVVGLFLVVAMLLAACSTPTRPTERLEPDAVLVHALTNLDLVSVGESGHSLQGSTTSGTIEIFVDEAGWMREVAYFIDGSRLAVKSESPFSVQLDTTSLSDGLHVLAVEPRMPNGQVRDAVEIEFRVDNAPATGDTAGDERTAGEEEIEPSNTAPTVDLGEDRVVRIDDRIELVAAITDDGLPNGHLAVEWLQSEGPGQATFDPADAAATQVTFSETGRYVLRARVSDGELRAIDSIEITVESPATGDSGEVDGGSDGDAGDETQTAPQQPSTGFDPASIVWLGDMETGDISQWSEDVEGLNMGCGGPQNNGGGTAYGSADVARSGSYSAAMRISDVSGDQGTRLFRGRCESQLYPEGLYYTTWFYLPHHFETPDGWWNIVQIKSKPWGYDGGSDPMWVLDLLDQGDGTMRLRLRDKISGSSVYYGSAEIDFPIGEWVQIQVFFKGGSENDGEIVVWQDGAELWNFSGIDTLRGGGDIRWAVNNYTSAIRPDPSIIYVDDAVISTAFVGPDANLEGLR